MQGITVHQPWASLIADGIKNVEIRKHNRFDSLVNKKLFIHAGKKYDNNFHNKTCLSSTNPSDYFEEDWLFDDGQIIATVFIDDIGIKIVDMTNSCIDLTLKKACISRTYFDSVPDKEKYYAYFLSRPQRFEIPILIKGRQGIWKHEIP